ncbi:transforming growth factor beta activator LRRC33 isoform X2 [Nothobranchius furzeri]|uniref:transforming growth factor beta activator LRRC33 isoform X2 n=1 Tax=Nothobranchius furzeri TaxID=105023 RepID=UPI00077D4C22
MAGHMFSSLLLLWSVSHEPLITGGTYFAAEVSPGSTQSKALKKQSWSKQNLFTVPADLDVTLRSLDLSNNFIRQLPTLALPDLEQLDLSSNRLDLISEGAFQDLARLKNLNLSRNQLNINLGSNSKALGSLGRLKSLDVSKNGLSNDAAELFLKNKPTLDHLKMTGNALIRLSHSLFRESGSLKTITVDDNLISEIAEGTFEPLKQLETLNLAMNNLAHICDFKLSQLKYLNLSRNSVEFFVTREDYQLYSLEILDLSYNKLLYFPIVPKMNQLKYLHLQNNALGGYVNSEAAMVSEINALYNEIVKNRRAIKNSLHANWRLMPLVYIDLSFNHFTFFPLETLNLLSSVETLHFSNNCLQNIHWNIRNYNDSRHARQLFFHSLKHLNLQSNGLVYISPRFIKALTQIETLNLQDNSVQPCAENFSRQQISLKAPCAAFGQMTTLKHLNLRENGIKLVTQNSLQRNSLTYLNLRGNRHLVMHERALEGVQSTLQTLIISETNMSDLTLPCLTALTELNMSNNNLYRMPSSLSCSPLKAIDIRNNKFKTLNHSLIQHLSKNLAVMFISGNQFDCCNSEWMSILKETHLPDINETECFTHKRNFLVAEYLKSPSLYCLLHSEAQGVHFGQMIIIVFFLSLLLTGLIVFSRKFCCTQGSLCDI